MRRLVRAVTGSLLAAAVAGGAGCALELVPQGGASVPSPRHGASDAWASEPSSRWTISIQPDTGEDESAPAEVAAAVPPAVAVRSEPLAPAAASQPEIHVASDAGVDDLTSSAAVDPSRVTVGEPSAPAPAVVAARETTAPASRVAELPTYVSPRSLAAPADAPDSPDLDAARALDEPASAAPVTAAAVRSEAPRQAPYVVEPPRRGGGEPRDPSDSASDVMLDPEYRIGVEDLLDVSLLGEPDLQHVTMRVSPRGTVDFPYAGTLTAAGLSVEEFRSALLEKLDDYYVTPQVTVFLREYRSRMVHILGEVPRPGPFKLTHRNTLMEVLSRAGGFTPLANKGDVQIIRSDAAGKRIIRVDVTEIIDDGRIDLDIPLESGDVINVPERLF